MPAEPEAISVASISLPRIDSVVAALIIAAYLSVWRCQTAFLLNTKAVPKVMSAIDVRVSA